MLARWIRIDDMEYHPDVNQVGTKRMHRPEIGNAYGLKFHHLGLAVREPTAAVRFLTALGYVAEEEIEDPLQNVKLIMCRHAAMPDVEIIYSAGGASPTDRFLKSQNEGLIYHVCYETDDLSATLSEVERQDDFRMVCVSPPKPAVLFGGRNVSFYVVVGVGLIEVIDQR